MISLQGKIAIITGASSGIGLATAQLFLEQGASVHGVDVSPAASVLLENPKFRFQQHFGRRIDILLDIAGVMGTNNSVDTMDPDMWDRVITINLTVPAFLSKAVVNVFKKQKSGGSSIVKVARKAALSGGLAGAAYTANKHGVVGLTKNIAWRFHDEASDATRFALDVQRPA
ncbi:hypothetical protein BDW68DRAFT_175865 [Aspergillus falconensis]